MGNVSTNVTTGKPNIAGAVFVAPKGTTLPTDATTQLADAFKCLGYVSEDGLENENDMDVSAIKAWGGMIVYRSLNELNDNFKLTLLETKNIDVLKTVYGADNVTDDDGAIAIEIKAENPTEMVWVFELSLRGGSAKRIVVKEGAITSRDSITYKDDEAVAFGITVSAYPDENGVSHKEYIA